METRWEVTRMEVTLPAWGSHSHDEEAARHCEVRVCHKHGAQGGTAGRQGGAGMAFIIWAGLDPRYLYPQDMRCEYARI